MSVFSQLMMRNKQNVEKKDINAVFAGTGIVDENYILSPSKGTKIGYLKVISFA